MPRIGPFFYVFHRLLFHAIAPEKGENRAGKLDDPFSHRELFERRFPGGDYIDYPRGRVVWDTENGRAIVYIDRCIRKPEILKRIADAFELTDYEVREDAHYRCKNCLGSLWDD